MTLTPEQFRAAEELFNRLLEESDETRERELAAHDKVDTRVAREVRNMLARELSPTVSRPGVEALAQQAQALRRESEEAPVRIGRYRLVSLLGEGGMGQVFEAEQEEPVRRTVALKLIRAGLSGKDGIARFEAEQQALAVMDHPNIARVLDAGVHADGRPYFVMELVSGQPITRYCRDHQLSVTERLELFLEVVEAVQHAHQKGVVHRDLKPSNILVSAPGEAESSGRSGPSSPQRQSAASDARSSRRSSPGNVRVIDFGIAKAVDDPLLGETHATKFGDFVGTPEYMSPEQASLGEVDIDIRSDVYALGLVLYELLTGELPLSRQELRAAGFDEMRRLVREQEAPNPSKKVHSAVSAGNSSATSEFADSCGLDSGRLAKRLRGDLDWIIQKALAKERRRRYQTAGDFGADLVRHLEDQPVEAGPPTLRYRMSKFVRRNRAAVIAASLIGASIVAGLFGTSYGLLSARASARQAETEKNTAERTLRFLGDLFQAADPRERAGREITVNEVLDRGAQSIDSLNEEPATQLRLLGMFGDIYRSQGRFDQAEGILERVVAFEAPEGSVEPERLVRQQLLAAARLSGIARDRGEFDEAERVISEQLAKHEALLPSTDTAIGGSYNALGTIYRQQGRYGEARAAYQRALEVTEANQNQAGQASILNNLATVATYLGNLEEAADLQARSIESFRGLLPDNHPNFLILEQNLAVILRRHGRLQEALASSERAVAIGRIALGEEHPSLADALQNLARLQMNLGRQAEAVESLREGLAIIEASVGLDTVQATRLRAPLARSLWELGQRQEAIQQLRLATPISREKMSLGDQGGWLTYQRKLATYLRWVGEVDEAWTLSDQMVEQASTLDASVVSREEWAALAWLQRAIWHADDGAAEAAESYARALELAQCIPDEPCVLDSPESDLTRAGYYAVTGELDRAFARLEHFFARPERRHAAVASPDYELLRSDARFAAFESRWHAAVAGQAPQ